MSTRTITFNDSFSSASAPTGVDGISNWVTAQAYLVSDVVIQGSKIYECLIAHTAGVFATDLAAVKWGEISQGAVDHTALSNIGTNTHAQIDTHLANTSNPHSVTKAQVGLTNVDDTSDATKNAASVTLTNKTITGADFRTPIRLDMKQDTLANLTTYASTAADGQLCFATDTKDPYVVKNNLLSSISGAGDVVGPASSTDNAVAIFNLTTGKLIQDSVVTVGDTGAVSGVTSLTLTGQIAGTQTIEKVQNFNVASGAIGSSWTRSGTANTTDENYLMFAAKNAGGNTEKVMSISSIFGNTSATNGYSTLRINSTYQNASVQTDDLQLRLFGGIGTTMFGLSDTDLPTTNTAGTKLLIRGRAEVAGVSADAEFGLCSVGGSGRSYTLRSATDGRLLIRDNTAASVRIELATSGLTTFNAGVSIDAGGFKIATSTPASASATGITGTIAWDTSFIYICTATNTWKRVGISTW